MSLCDVTLTLPTRSFGVEFFFAFEQLLVVLELFVELVELFESFVLEFVLFEQHSGQG